MAQPDALSWARVKTQLPLAGGLDTSMDAERETVVSGIDRKHSPSALSASQGTRYPFISWCGGG